MLSLADAVPWLSCFSVSNTSCPSSLNKTTWGSATEQHTIGEPTSNTLCCIWLTGMRNKQKPVQLTYTHHAYESCLQHFLHLLTIVRHCTTLRGKQNLVFCTTMCCELLRDTFFHIPLSIDIIQHKTIVMHSLWQAWWVYCYHDKPSHCYHDNLLCLATLSGKHDRSVMFNYFLTVIMTGLLSLATS